MKTVNDLYPKNMNKIERIQHQLNVLQKEVDELKREETEPKLFVPKEIGILLIGCKMHLIFNNNKSIFYSRNNLFEIGTNDKDWVNENTGDNIQLIKTTFKEIKDGDFFLDDIDLRNDAQNYDLKINGYPYYINGNNEIIFDVFDSEREVYKLKLI